MKKHLASILLLLLPAVLIIYAPQAVRGASAGLVLWFNQVLPVLFPFALILQLIMSANALSGISCLTAPIMQKCLHLSPACSFCLLAGFLCGFPMGTTVSVQAFENGLISRKEAQLLSGVCNHASPMFFGGYILNQILPDHPLHSCLILIFYASPFLWFLLRCFFLHHPPVSVPDRAVAKNTRPSAPLPFRTILLNASELMLKIGVCMMIFSILQAIIGSLPFVPASLSAVLALFLEITSGSAAVRLLPLQLCLKTSLIMGGTAFGGLCIAFQSFALLRTQKLSCVQYLADKSAVGMITAALVWILYQIV